MDPTIPTSARPRRLPLLINLGVLFGGMFAPFAWVFFTVGMFFVWALGAHADVYSFLHFRGKLETTDGTVTAADNTRFTEGGGKHSRGISIYEYHYRFTTGGKTYESVSYKTGGGAKVNRIVPVEFVPGHPEISRIRGARKAPFGPEVLFVFIFPLVGLGFALPDFLKGCKNVKLLRNGEITKVRFLMKEPTSMAMVYKLTFIFIDAQGAPHHAIAKTHRPERLLDDRHEVLFYNPRTPSESVLLDSLPGNLQISAMGQLRSTSSRELILKILPPLAAFLVIAIGIVVKCCR